MYYFIFDMVNYTSNSEHTAGLLQEKGRPSAINSLGSPLPAIFLVNMKTKI